MTRWKFLKKKKSTFTNGHQSCCSILVGPRRHLLPSCSWEPHFCGMLHIGSHSVSPSVPQCLHMDMEQWQNERFRTPSFIYGLFNGRPVTQVGDTSGVAELLYWRSSSAPTEVQCEYGHFEPQIRGLRCFSVMFKLPPFMLGKAQLVIVAQLTHMPLFLPRTEICVWILIGQLTTSNCLNVWDDVLLISSRAAAVQLEGRESTLCNWFHTSSGWCHCCLLTASCCFCVYPWCTTHASSVGQHQIFFKTPCRTGCMHKCCSCKFLSLVLNLNCWVCIFSPHNTS